MADKVVVLVGTRKGAWVYTSDRKRDRWELSEPILPGWSIYSHAVDTRSSTPRFYSAANHWAWGRSVGRSEDGGKTWEQRTKGLGFPKDLDLTIGNVWSVAPAHESQPGVVYAGTQPAGLFRSEDWGATWESVDTINRHEWRQFWTMSGGGDSCIHTVAMDPRQAGRYYVSVATGGTFYTADDGKTWSYRNYSVFPTTQMAKDMMADLLERFPEFADQPIPPGVDPASVNEFHKIRVDLKKPDRLWGQAHMGVFRSDDRGEHWTDVTEGLPSFHGFPIAVTKTGPDAAFVVPLAFERDNFRVCDGQLAVYRTTDEGDSWERLTKGLPGPNDFQSVYREAMDTDGLESEGVYVGTTNGEVYASADRGDSWQRLPGTLPPILSVTATVI